MNKALTKYETTITEKEGRAVQELAVYFDCENSCAAVFESAFDWYYVPRSSDRRAYAQRVTNTAVRAVEETGLYPDWFWRVYECLITGEDTIGSVSPPLDPKQTA